MPLHVKKINYRKSLAVLGIAASTAYASPLVTTLGEVHASGGGFFGAGRKPAGFGSGSGGFIINDKITLKECSDCHQAYGGDALPRNSWQRIMGNLDNHFGEDASLDEPTRAHIENYLLSKALNGSSSSLRISDQAWYISAHHNRGARRKGNCIGCHGGGGGYNGGNSSWWKK